MADDGAARRRRRDRVDRLKKVSAGALVIPGIYLAMAVNAGEDGDSGLLQMGERTVTIGEADLINDGDSFDTRKVRAACGSVPFFLRPIVGAPDTVRVVFSVAGKALGEETIDCDKGTVIKQHEYS